MNGPSIDPQILGVFDCGLPEGAVRSEPFNQVVPVPFREQSIITNITAGAIHTGGAVGTGGENNDGSVTTIYATTVSSDLTGYKHITHLFYGTVYGLRFEGVAADALCVEIDGEAFPVPGYQGKFQTNQAEGTSLTHSPSSSGNHGVIIASNLPDGVHIATIMIPGKLSGSNAVNFYGFLGDARYYNRQQPLNRIQDPVSLTSSYAAVGVGSSGRQMRGIKKILYWNTDSVTRIVSLQFNAQDMWSKSIVAGESTELDLGGVGHGSGDLKHKCDAAGVVKATVIGGI